MGRHGRRLPRTRGRPGLGHQRDPKTQGIAISSRRSWPARGAVRWLPGPIRQSSRVQEAQTSTSTRSVKADGKYFVPPGDPVTFGGCGRRGRGRSDPDSREHAGDKVLVRVLMNHEMESGQRKDADGKISRPTSSARYGPAKRQDGPLGAVGSRRLKNPFLQFTFAGGSPGQDPVTWVDNQGRHADGRGHDRVTPIGVWACYRLRHAGVPPMFSSTSPSPSGDHELNEHCASLAGSWRGPPPQTPSPSIFLDDDSRVLYPPRPTGCRRTCGRSWRAALPLAQQGFTPGVFHQRPRGVTDEVATDPRFEFHLFRRFRAPVGAVIPCCSTTGNGGAVLPDMVEGAAAFAEHEVTMLAPSAARSRCSCETPAPA